jgi:outer membrane immunogenic protein
MKKFALTFAILCAACTFTFAGNERYPSKESPVVQLPGCAQFGGFDVGLNIGGAMLYTTWNDKDSWADEFDDDFALSNPSKDRAGVTVGGTVGYNWQKGCALFGLIVDGSWTSIEGSTTYTPSSDTDTSPTVIRLHDDLNFWATARARSGVVVDSLLLYITGGFAFADLEHHWHGDSDEIEAVTIPTGGTVAHEGFSADSFRWGGVMGVGAEWALNDRWSVRSEYLYAYFMEEHTGGFSETADQHVHFDSQDHMSVAQICLIYRFGGK